MSLLSNTLLSQLVVFYNNYYHWANDHFESLKLVLPDLILIAIAFYVFRKTYVFFFHPLKINVNAPIPLELDKIDPWRKEVTGASVAALNRLRKSVGKIPPPYPRYGWFFLALSSDLPHPGSILRINALGKHIVLFRGKTDPTKVHALDAYCVHNGADLGGGKVVCVEEEGEAGRIKKDCIQCPFHGWTFSAEDGSCKIIPYETNVPRVAQVKT